MTVAAAWPPGPGVLELPSGRSVLGRSLRRPVPGDLLPEFGLHLAGVRPRPVPWPTRWVRWPDFALPLDGRDARDALRETWERAAHERVEVGCGGGRGRTGTALAGLLVLEGVAPDEAVARVRGRYDRHAVETPWQRRWVARLAR